MNTRAVQEVAAARAQGHTLKEIAARYRITIGRVRSLLAKHRADGELVQVDNPCLEFPEPALAAAPEMLAALKAANEFIGRCDDWRGDDPPVKMIRDAIAKAEVAATLAALPPAT